ncbi:uncharacterized protein B0H18DRAFT_960725 [Fomitopsis serialis]|uniref:uncharacterized protein n=1 Tax=Fomitopsis serialis TaxID=139415 RepID=UPI002008AF3C|nr:uncharacterized protein B0H18DRAFT_960725 [Neoantrodia serialis]KAH9912893.1 hypothetical protein B0H18DRAFT_960725 [Neoantrodia serialis]
MDGEPRPKDEIGERSLSHRRVGHWPQPPRRHVLKLNLKAATDHYRSLALFPRSSIASDTDKALQDKALQRRTRRRSARHLQKQHGIKHEGGGPLDLEPWAHQSDTTIPTQIHASVGCSLHNLHTTYLNNLLLHSPLSAARTARRAAERVDSAHERDEQHVRQRLQRKIGHRGRAEPTLEGNAWVYRYCRESGIQYQSFWTLSGSPSLLTHFKSIVCRTRAMTVA